MTEFSRDKVPDIVGVQRCFKTIDIKELESILDGSNN